MSPDRTLGRGWVDFVILFNIKEQNPIQFENACQRQYSLTISTHFHMIIVYINAQMSKFEFL